MREVLGLLQGRTWGSREMWQGGVGVRGSVGGADPLSPPEMLPLVEELVEGGAALSPGSPSSGASGSDLRFHHLHGSNAVITNGGRTALRHNCRSEFNDAIVISNRCVSPSAQGRLPACPGAAPRFRISFPASPGVSLMPRGRLPACPELASGPEPDSQ